MIARKLAFVEHCRQLKAEGKHEELEAICRQELTITFSTKGWHVVVDLMRDVVDNALEAIGKDDRGPFYAGQIHAVEQIREKLRELFSGAAEYVDEYDEGLIPLEESERI